MNRSYCFMRTGMGVCLLCRIMVGCSSVTLSNIAKKPLPASPSALTELTLALPPEGGPQRPVNSSGPSALKGSPLPIIIIEEDPTAFRATAEQDARVKEHLGDRFAFIRHEVVPADHCLGTSGKKGAYPEDLGERSSTEVKAHRLTYYSYSHNSATQVCLQENHMASVQP